MPKNRNTTMEEKDETRAEIFVRLANNRVRKTLNSIRLIGNLGSYPHTAQQTAKVIGALRTAIDSVEYSLGGEKQEEEGFSLND